MGIFEWPRRNALRSVPHVRAVETRTTTSPGPGTGVSTSWYAIFPGSRRRCANIDPPRPLGASSPQARAGYEIRSCLLTGYPLVKVRGPRNHLRISEKLLGRGA